MLRWFMPNNSTHGIITAIVDVKNGLKPSDVEVYVATTLSTKRLLTPVERRNDLENF